MINDWITSFSRWQTLMAVSTATAVFCAAAGAAVPLVSIAVANGTPVIAKRLLGETWGRPLDSGATWFDGRPWFGPSKTIRGVVLSLLATPPAAMVMGLS